MWRALVVDDSVVSRRLLRSLLERDPELEVAGEAEDGRAAVAAAMRLRPDVIVMDVRMPEMDGLEATKEIMRRCAAPIVLVTAGTGRPEVDMSFAALEAGALAILDKPAVGGDGRSPETAEFVETVKLMAEVRVVGRRFDVRSAPGRGPGFDESVSPEVDVVAIAASTGGPAALAKILRGLPAGLRVPVLVVQHIGPGFDEGLVSWLAASSALPVRLAAAGDRLRPGEVVVCPHDRHLGLAGGMRVELSDAEPVRAHRPSATYLFRSIARAPGVRGLGIILTGMGEDGMQGLVELKQSGGLIVAQDEATSVVYGMPARIVERGIADAVLPVEEIAAAIVAATGTRSPRA